MPQTITIQALDEAVRKLSGRTPVGSVLGSAQWADVPLELRERAFFSSRVTSLRLLSAMQEKLLKVASMTVESVGGDKTAYVDRSSFIADMRKLATALGVQTVGTEGAGTVRDIRSRARLGLVYDMQTQQAAEYARWKMDQDKDVMAAYPAQRLIRVEQRRVPRNWTVRWDEAGARVNWVGAKRGLRVALKSSGIWRALSRFGTPWPPFDYNSGMGLEDVDRTEAIRLGLIQVDEEPESAEGDFNDALEVDAGGLSEPFRGLLKSVFGDRIEEQGDRVVWRGAA